MGKFDIYPPMKAPLVEHMGSMLTKDALSEGRSAEKINPLIEELRGIYRKTNEIEKTVPPGQIDDALKPLIEQYSDIRKLLDAEGKYVKNIHIQKIENALGLTANRIAEVGTDKSGKAITNEFVKWHKNLDKINKSRANYIKKIGRESLKKYRRSLPHYKRITYAWRRWSRGLFQFLDKLDLLFIAVDLGMAQYMYYDYYPDVIYSEYLVQGEPGEEIFDEEITLFTYKYSYLAIISYIIDFFQQEDDTMTGQEIWSTLQMNMPGLSTNPHTFYDTLARELDLLIDDKEKLMDLYMRGEIAMIEEINDWDELRQYFEDTIYDTYNSIRNYHEVIFMEEIFGTWNWPDLVPGK